MSSQTIDWHVICDQPTFEKCKQDEKFAYIVTLARAVNAIYFVHAAISGRRDPNFPRCKTRSLQFISVRVRNYVRSSGAYPQDESAVFGRSRYFRMGCDYFLKDKIARKIERAHLDPVRNSAVFHFDPEAFAKTIERASCEECPFISGGGGPTRLHTTHPFADIIACEILIGFAANTEEFYSASGSAMAETE